MDDKKIRKSVKEFYNKNADHFSNTRQNWWNDLVFIKDYLGNGGKLLDFGCGNGRLLELINDPARNIKGINYWGVDISSELLKCAQKRYPLNKFSLIDSEDELSFSDNFFDLVVSIAVFHHFTPKMAEKSLLELKRVLRPNGILFFSWWVLWKKKHQDEYWAQQSGIKKNEGVFLSFQKNKANKREGRYYYYWELNKMVNLVKKAGFKVVDQGFTYNSQGEKRNYYLVAKKV